MKVVGQLEEAQLENLTSAPANTPAGRVYFDTATGKSWVYNSVTSTWKEFQYVSTAGTDFYDNGSSGKAITINWTNGNNQKVTLSDNCIISFQNPVAGQTYTLLVKQRNFDLASTGAYPYKYLFNLLDQASKRTILEPNVRAPYQPQGTTSSTEGTIHQWFYSAAIQAAYANVGTSITNPQTLPATAGLCIDINPRGDNLVLGSATSPYHYNYALLDRGRQFEYGRQNSVTPTTLITGSTSCVKYSPDGSMFAITTSATTFASLYMVRPENGTNTGGLYTALSGGDIPPGTAAYSLDWHPTGSFLAIGSQGTAFLSAYKVSQAGWGSLIAPAVAAAGVCYSVAFSPYGDYIAAGMNASPYLDVYPFTPDATTPVIGTKVTQYTGTIAGGVGTTAHCARAVAWRPQGDFIAIGVQTSPYVYTIPFSRSTGVLGAATAFAGTDIPPGSVNCVAFSPCGSFLAVGSNTTPFLSVFAFTAAGLTTGKLTIDSGGPASPVFDLVWHPSGDYIFMATSLTPFLLGIPAPRNTRNYLRLI